MSHSIRRWPAPHRRQGRHGVAEIAGLAALTLTLGGLTACAGWGGSEPSSARRAAGLELDSSDDLSFQGPAGGRFQPALEVCTLRNAGGTDLRWTAESSAAWLAVRGPTAGVLRPQASIAIGVGIDSEASLGLPAGTHEAELRFEVSGDPGSLRRRRVVLQLEAAAVLAVIDPATIPSPASVGSTTGIDDAGWTALSPSPDTHTIYVSRSTGDDGNDGRSPDTAKRTIAAGIRSLRNHKPDWLLLKRGDVWQEALGQWSKSGRSPTEPLVVGWYGSETARPLLQTGTGGGVWITGNSTTENVAFIGLHFQAHTNDGSSGCQGASLLQPCKHILFEDCMFQSYHTNVVLQADEGKRHEDLRIRRCVIVDAFAVISGGHPQGLFARNVDGLLIEECVFDHNGWSEKFPDCGATIFRHNLYIQTGNTGAVVRGNIIANAASHGLQLRCGGTAMNNLFVRNSISLLAGGGNSPQPGGVTAIVTGNVILDGKDIDADTPRGNGLAFENIAQGQASGNLIAHNTLGRRPVGLALVGRDGAGVHDLRISGNVLYDWGGGIVLEGDASQLSGIVLEANVVQEPRLEQLVNIRDAAALTGLRWSGNRIHGQRVPGDTWVRIGQDRPPPAQWPPSLRSGLLPDADPVAYPDPQRDVPSYCHSLGRDASLDAFLEQARAQSKSRWLPEFTAAAVNRYLRAGFALSDP